MLPEDNDLTPVCPMGIEGHSWRRIACVYFPRFAIERWQRRMIREGESSLQDRPVALGADSPRGPVIHAINAVAEEAGVQVGGRVVDMRAVCPELIVKPASVDGDREILQRLMLWSRRWCPWTAVEGDSGLIMDTTGSDHLWGGESAMLDNIEQKMLSLGFHCNLAIAPTVGAAWALSRYGNGQEICSPNVLSDRAASLPVEALRLNASTVLLLGRLGLKTVGELAEVPLKPLARRFRRSEPSLNPLIRLDQMMGRAAEPINAPEEPSQFVAEKRLPEPSLDPAPYLPDLAESLCGDLAKAGSGARCLTLTVYRTDGDIERVEAATSQPTGDAGHVRRLFEGKLENLNPGFGFDMMTLEAPVAERVQVSTTRLDGSADGGMALARLVDRLSARFGGRAVMRPRFQESHVPERCETWQPALGKAEEHPGPAARPRPIRLMNPAEEIRAASVAPEGPPVRFVWRRSAHRVVRFTGPERIAPEWWKDKPDTRLRDYYAVESHKGTRLWIYREGIAGDGRGGAPRWFLQGVFE